jgi:uncharacterized protein Usg
VRLTVVEIMYKLSDFHCLLDSSNWSAYKGSVLHDWKNMEQWWNYYKIKPKYRERNISQCQFAFHKFHMDCPWTEPRVFAVIPRLNKFINATVHPSFMGLK